MDEDEAAVSIILDYQYLLRLAHGWCVLMSNEHHLTFTASRNASCTSCGRASKRAVLSISACSWLACSASIAFSRSDTGTSTCGSASPLSVRRRTVAHRGYLFITDLHFSIVMVPRNPKLQFQEIKSFTDHGRTLAKRYTRMARHMPIRARRRCVTCAKKSVATTLKSVMPVNVRPSAKWAIIGATTMFASLCPAYPTPSQVASPSKRTRRIRMTGIHHPSSLCSVTRGEWQERCLGCACCAVV